MSPSSAEPEPSGAEAELKRLTVALSSARQRLRQQETRLRDVLANLAHGLSLYDKRGKLVTCNQQFLDIYRLPAECGRRGTSFRRILEERVRANTHEGDDPATYMRERLALVPERRIANKITRLNTGQVISVSHQPIDGGGWVSTHKDLTDLYNVQAELQHLAYHDSLTGLPNRTLFYQRVGKAFEEEDGFAVLCLDLDGFKPINDTLGHASGDALLRQFAARLIDVIELEATAARMGGDEFAVLLPGSSPDAALGLARRIEEAVRIPFDLDGNVVSIAVGVGIALAPRDGRSIDALLHCADLALYAAKREKRGGIRQFEPAMDRAVTERRRLEHDLKRALMRGEFELYFQPIFDLRARDLAGFEALLRWRHPEHGMIAPSEFVPVAEEIGMIVPIGEWVLREAFAEAARWPVDLKVAVNVSSIQLTRGNLVSTVMHALAVAGIEHERAEIEITESVFLEDSERNLEILTQLRNIGVRVALDDFGTGFSALSYLIAFPFDRIKIDGSFVRALSSAEGAHTIVRAVAEIGAQMGMSTTAEGIETPEQLRNVLAAGYSEAQGYLISRPLSRDAVRRMLNAAYDVMPEAPMLRAG